MSIPISRKFENSYDCSMRYPSVSNWFNEAFINYERKTGRRLSITEFGDYLGKTQPTISAYMNGTRKPSYESALEICRRLDDYSLLDILGYARPEPRDIPFESLPPELLDLLKSIDHEIANTLRERSITPYSAEAEDVARDVLSKYGARLIEISNSGQESKQK